MVTTTSKSLALIKSMVAPSLHRSRQWRIAASVWLWLTAAAVAQGTETGVRSGQFEGLTLAVSGDGRLVGEYFEVQGANPGKKCQFFLTGDVNSSDHSMVSWSSHSLPGIITAEPKGVVLKIPRGRTHDGCGLVLPPEISEGLFLSLIKIEPWIELRTVTAKRAYFHNQPDRKDRQRAYVVAGDTLQVRAQQHDWLQVDFVKGARKYTGWMLAADSRNVASPTPR